MISPNRRRVSQKKRESPPMRALHPDARYAAGAGARRSGGCGEQGVAHQADLHARRRTAGRPGSAVEDRHRRLQPILPVTVPRNDRRRAWREGRVGGAPSDPGEELLRELDLMGAFKFPAIQFLSLALRHSTHHRGQLSSYLRAMGGKVPSIYGPTADTVQVSA